MAEREVYPTWTITLQIGGKRYQRAEVPDNVLEALGEQDVLEALNRLVRRPGQHHFPEVGDEVYGERGERG